MTQEQRDILLEKLSETVNEINEWKNKTDKTLTELTGKVNEINDWKKRTDKTLTELTETVDDIRLEVSDISEELVRQRRNMARMEYNLSEKIDALFDAREIGLEKFEEYHNKFRSIDDTFEKHHLRISKLESKQLNN